MTLPKLADYTPGLYGLDSVAFAGIAHLARQQGYHIATFKLEAGQDKAVLLDHFAKNLAFPDCFGHNLDALADCLNDLDWLPAPGHVLMFTNCKEALSSPPDWLQEVLTLMTECIDERARHGLPMWAFCDHPVQTLLTS